MLETASSPIVFVKHSLVTNSNRVKSEKDIKLELEKQKKAHEMLKRMGFDS